MRRLFLLALVLLGPMGACGRIGYAPLLPSDGGEEAAGTGAGGAGGEGGSVAATGGRTGAAGAGGDGTIGTGGAAGGGGGTGGGTVGTGGTGGAGGIGGVDGTGGSPGTGGMGGGGMGGLGGGAGASGIGGASGSGGIACATETFGGHAYAFCSVTAPWADAASDCALKGMRLVRIDDAGENAWVQGAAFAGISSTSSNFWSWIGGTDRAVPGDWRWMDGALFWVGGANGSSQGGLYSNWAAGSPMSGGGAATDCAILQHAGFWTDFDCARPQRYVCETY